MAASQASWLSPSCNRLSRQYELHIITMESTNGQLHLQAECQGRLNLPTLHQNGQGEPGVNLLQDLCTLSNTCCGALRSYRLKFRAYPLVFSSQNVWRWILRPLWHIRLHLIIGHVMVSEVVGEAVPVVIRKLMVLGLLFLLYHPPILEPGSDARRPTTRRLWGLWRARRVD